MIVNILIFLIGLVIYAGYGWAGLAYLAAAVLLTYGAGLLIPKHKWVMWVSVGLNAVMLVAMKLQPVLGIQLLSVLGISYFTLQIISYNVDIYKGKYEPERNLFRYAFFVTYIPHLFIGPVERYDVMAPRLQERRMSWEGIAQGAARACWGLFKKFVIAARAGVIVSAISGDVEQYTGGFALLAMAMYSVQLYADFSGGIDMVLGLSRMLGLSMSENFDAPYFSQSVKEFWNRWHMTLGTWLKNYIYIPLGGNRKGKVRQVLNLIVTFLVSGFWHGVQYLLWGLFNGIFVAFGQKLQTKWKFVNQLGTFLAITFLWAFFVWPDALTALKMAGSVFTTFNYGAVAAAFLELGLNVGEWIVLAVGVAALWLYDAFRDRINNTFNGLRPAGKAAVVCALGLLVLVLGMYGIGFNAEEFIYSRF